MNTKNIEKKKILPTETLKVCIIGESSVGKSCLLTRWAGKFIYNDFLYTEF